MDVWPEGFERVPDEPWTRTPIRELAVDYDTVEQHGWYDNLDPTVREVADALDPGDVLVDYSGGTGILVERLLDAVDEPFGVVDVDSSRKFLRLALDKLADDDRVAFRLIRYLDDRGRLEFVDEVLGDALLDRGIDALVSTNAIHLYYNLPETLASWRRILRDDGTVFVQSGNIERSDRPSDRWIIDATVRAVDDAARKIVREDDRYEPYRERLEDDAAMEAYSELRDRYFLPARDVTYYLSHLTDAGFEVDRVVHRPVEVDRSEWSEFLQVYDDGVLGWVGGAERVEGKPPSKEALEDRKRLIDEALDRVVDGAGTFEAEWTYITCRPA